MPGAGIDVGSLTTKAVIFEDGKVLSKCLVRKSEEAELGARQALDEALRAAGLSQGDLSAILVTGSGRKFVSFATAQKTSASCLAKGISLLYPQVRTLFDIGAETSSVLRLNAKGLVEESVGHDRCASGTGVFLETMARLMMLPLEEFARLSLGAARRAEISSMCAVFAESEVISHVHRVPPTPKQEIAAGILGSMAMRLSGMGKRIGVKPDVAISGGVARNIGFVKALEENIKLPVVVPDDPEFIAALGAARAALEHRVGSA